METRISYSHKNCKHRQEGARACHAMAMAMAGALLHLPQLPLRESQLGPQGSGALLMRSLPRHVEAELAEEHHLELLPRSVHRLGILPGARAFPSKQPLHGM